jgi:hypothetical protein
MWVSNGDPDSSGLEPRYSYANVAGCFGTLISTEFYLKNFIGGVLVAQYLT